MAGHISYNNLNQELQDMINNRDGLNTISPVAVTVSYSNELYPFGGSMFALSYNPNKPQATDALAIAWAKAIYEITEDDEVPVTTLLVTTLKKEAETNIDAIAIQCIDVIKDSIAHGKYFRINEDVNWGDFTQYPTINPSDPVVRTVNDKLPANDGNVDTDYRIIDPIEVEESPEAYPNGSTDFVVDRDGKRAYTPAEQSWIDRFPPTNRTRGDNETSRINVRTYKDVRNDVYLQEVDSDENGYYEPSDYRFSTDGLIWSEFLPVPIVKSINEIFPDEHGNVVIPDASDTVKGLVQLDGTTIVSNNGIISAIGGSDEPGGVTHITPLPPTASYDDYPNGTSIFAVEYNEGNLDWYEALNLTPVEDYEEIAGFKPSGKVAVTTFKSDNLLNQIVQIRDAYGNVDTIGRYWTLIERRWFGGVNRSNSIDGNIKKVNGVLPDIHGNVTIGSLPPDPSLLPNASTTQKGIVQLTNDTTGESETLAVTQKGIKDAVADITTNITTIIEQEFEDGAYVKTVNEIEPIDGNVTIPSATTLVEGTVQLTSDITGESEVLAVTQKAIKEAVGTINTNITNITEQVQELEESDFVKSVNTILPIDGDVTIPNASTTVKGIVKVDGSTIVANDGVLTANTTGDFRIDNTITWTDIPSKYLSGRTISIIKDGDTNFAEWLHQGFSQVLGVWDLEAGESRIEIFTDKINGQVTQTMDIYLNQFKEGQSNSDKFFKMYTMTRTSNDGLATFKRAELVIDIPIKRPVGSTDIFGVRGSLYYDSFNGMIMHKHKSSPNGLDSTGWVPVNDYSVGLFSGTTNPTNTDVNYLKFKEGTYFFNTATMKMYKCGYFNSGENPNWQLIASFDGGSSPEGLPKASITQEGIVQLTNESGDSEVLALTQLAGQKYTDAISLLAIDLDEHEAVKATEAVLGHVKVDNVTITADEEGVISAVTPTVSPDDLPKATTLQEGIVQLTNSTVGTSEILAVTQKGINDTVATINTNITNITEQIQELEDAGFVKTVNEIEPVDGDVTIPDADYFTKGLVYLTSEPVFNEDKAISSGAVAIMDDILNHHLASKADASNTGHVRPDGTTIEISATGTISAVKQPILPADLPVATSSVLGVVKYDDTTIKVNANGQLYTVATPPVGYKLEEEYFESFIDEGDKTATITAEIDDIDNKVIRFYDGGMLLPSSQYTWSVSGDVVTFTLNDARGFPIDLIMTVTWAVSL